MFFLSNRTCRTGLSRFGKLTFPKSADSQFLKTADCDYSEICRNKVTAYSFTSASVSTFLGNLRFHLTILYFKFVLALTTKKESVRCIL